MVRKMLDREQGSCTVCYNQDVPRVQICQKSRRIGCVIMCCKLPWGSRKQPILQLLVNFSKLIFAKETKEKAIILVSKIRNYLGRDDNGHNGHSVQFSSFHKPHFALFSLPLPSLLDLFLIFTVGQFVQRKENLNVCLNRIPLSVPLPPSLPSFLPFLGRVMLCLRFRLVPSQCNCKRML